MTAGGLAAATAIARSGWSAAVASGVVAAAAVVATGVALGDVVAFAAYISIGVAVPGFLLARALRDRTAQLGEHLALGLAVGYALEIGTYAVARALGVPLAVLVWPAATLVAFVAIPQFRRYWRADARPTHPFVAWGLALSFAVVIGYSATSFFSSHKVTGSYSPYVDMPYHLALVAEMRHHVPPSIPYVDGEPLSYHWFFYLDPAATSWVTGIEPATLLFRLSLLPMLAGFIVLTSSAAVRLTGKSWSGVVAVAIALFAAAPNPYAWTQLSVFDTQTLIATWTSPTTVFALLMLSAILVVLIDVLREPGLASRRQWALLILLATAVSAAKATVLPILLAGLVAVVVVSLWRRAPSARAGLTALVIVGLAFGFAFLVAFHGATGGGRIAIETLQNEPVLAAVASAQARAAFPALSIVALGITASLWAMLWAGAVPLVIRPHRTLSDPAIVLLIGVCAAAVAAALFLSYPGRSQLYYLRSATAAFALASVAGIAQIMPATVPRRIVVISTALALAAGALLVTSIRLLGPGSPPRFGVHHLSGMSLRLAVPIAALTAGLVIAFLFARWITRDVPALRGATAVLVVAVALGFAVPAGLHAVTSAQDTSGRDEIPAAGIAAARWLRDHSQPSDLVATNLHCLVNSKAVTSCDPRHFWVSAYSERHMLVEGWAYTSTTNTTAARLGVNYTTIPFWEPERLRANDAAFVSPSVVTTMTLASRYRVRWLFADLSRASSTMGLFAVEEFRTGDFAVYELMPRGAHEAFGARAADDGVHLAPEPLLRGFTSFVTRSPTTADARPLVTGRGRPS